MPRGSLCYFLSVSISYSSLNLPVNPFLNYSKSTESQFLRFSMALFSLGLSLSLFLSLSLLVCYVHIFISIYSFTKKSLKHFLGPSSRWLFNVMDYGAVADGTQIIRYLETMMIQLIPCVLLSSAKRQRDQMME